MIDISAEKAGQFRIGGELTVNRLGFGAMRIVGPGVWGPPSDPESAKNTLRQLSSLGINFIDTADSYGPYDSENLIREVLHPYDGLVVATKGGLTRPGPEQWAALGRPEYLRQCVLTSLRRLGLDQIALWQLHRVDPKVPRAEQFSAIADMQREGLIRHVGLSEVGIDDIVEARKHFRIATVQNRYNLVDRTSEDVLAYCEEHGIGFIPWFPLAAGKLTEHGSLLEAIANRHKVTKGAVAVAWLLKRSPVLLPIPGTSNADHLAENVAGASITLSAEEFDELDRQGRLAQ